MFTISKLLLVLHIRIYGYETNYRKRSDKERLEAD